MCGLFACQKLPCWVPLGGLPPGEGGVRGWPRARPSGRGHLSCSEGRRVVGGGFLRYGLGVCNHKLGRRQGWRQPSAQPTPQAPLMSAGLVIAPGKVIPEEPTARAWRARERSSRIGHENVVLAGLPGVVGAVSRLSRVRNRPGLAVEFPCYDFRCSVVLYSLPDLLVWVGGVPPPRGHQRPTSVPLVSSGRRDSW